MRPSPRPEPAAPEARAAWPRNENSKARCCSPALMPTPVSLMTTKAWDPDRPARIRTWPPAGVYFTALSRTFRNARCTASESARTGSSGLSAMNSIRRRSSWARR